MCVLPPRYEVFIMLSAGLYYKCIKLINYFIHLFSLPAFSWVQGHGRWPCSFFLRNKHHGAASGMQCLLFMKNVLQFHNTTSKTSPFSVICQHIFWLVCIFFLFQRHLAWCRCCSCIWTVLFNCIYHK